MNKTELLNKFSKDGEQRTQLARVLDQMQRCETRSIPCATQFLSPALRASVELLLDACGHPKHRFCGGYEDAERTVCVFLPHWQETEDYVADEELAAVSAAFPRQADLTHRDILGGLMGIGITREKLGDILMGDHQAQIVCLREALPIVLSQFSQAGRYPLKLQEIPLSQLSPAPPDCEGDPRHRGHPAAGRRGGLRVLPVPVQGVPAHHHRTGVGEPPGVPENRPPGGGGGRAHLPGAG